MQILAVDVGAGTQDILLFDTELQPENCFKMVMPSPTMKVARQVRKATKTKQSILLQGVTMGGGPSHWAVRDHALAGNSVYATPHAARSFDDDLVNVQEMGVEIVDDDKASQIAQTQGNLLQIDLCDFDYGAIQSAFYQFGLPIEPDGVAVAVFDHGAAPPDVSDRQFRFDYLEAQIEKSDSLTTFAFASDSVPASMTRLQSVVTSAAATGLPHDIPLMVMDTAPAAVLGALLDPHIEEQEDTIVANVGNFHTLAFRLQHGKITGLFEHHTGHLNTEKLDDLLLALAASTLKHTDVFDDHGHGALIRDSRPAVPKFYGLTGPRRSMMNNSCLNTYFAVPYGDMMLAGCFGLVRAWATRYPSNHDEIMNSLTKENYIAPWELLN